jgi:hypothetical protein
MTRPRREKALVSARACACALALAGTIAGGPWAAVTAGAAPDVSVSNLPGNESEVTIDINPTDPSNLVIVGHSANRTEMHTFYSADAGQTWTLVALGDAEDGLTSTFRFDPAVAFDDDGNIYVAYGAQTAFATVAVIVAKSTDGGATYPQVVQVAEDTGPGFFGNDKWLLATGPDPVDPGQQNVYLAWSQNGSENSDIDQRIVVSVSTDGGQTFSTPMIINDASIAGSQIGNITAEPAVGPNGELYVSWFNRMKEEIFLDVSLDGGVTFGTDLFVTDTGVGLNTFIPAAPDNGVHAGPTLEVDRSGGPFDGRLYLAYTDLGPGGLPDTDIHLRFSDDGGTTWSTPRRVNDDGGTGSQFLPWVDVDQATGDLTLVWYDARCDVNNKQVAVFAAGSTDGGDTIAGNVRVSDGRSDQSEDNPDRATWNYSEYIGVAALAGNAYPVWADNSRDPADLDFFVEPMTGAVATIPILSPLGTLLMPLFMLLALWRRRSS